MKTEYIFKVKCKARKMGNRGYALLFAVLVSAIVLGVGVSILNISRKEILLTSGAQQSKYAFYAADAGYECALYQDHVNNAFTSTSTGSTFSLSECGETFSGATPSSYAPTVTETNPNSNVYQFVFNVPVSQTGSCAAVTLTKTYTTVVVGTSTNTTVSTNLLSDGFNVGWEASPGDCNAATSTPKVERALLATY